MVFSIENPPVDNAENNIKKLIQDHLKKDKSLLAENNTELKEADIQLLVENLITVFKSKGGQYNKNVNTSYNKIRKAKTTFLARRENPYNLLNTIIKQKDIELNPVTDKGERYANSVLLKYPNAAEELNPAFEEGKASLPGNIVFVVIYQVNPQINIIDDKHKNIHPSSYNRHNIKSAKGIFSKEDIKHIIIRCPVQNFPEEMLTDREEDILDAYLDHFEETGKKQKRYILRGFDF